MTWDGLSYDAVADPRADSGAALLLDAYVRGASAAHVVHYDRSTSRTGRQ
jgi:hypothetical protein